MNKKKFLIISSVFISSWIFFIIVVFLKISFLNQNMFNNKSVNNPEQIQKNNEIVPLSKLKANPNIKQSSVSGKLKSIAKDDYKIVLEIDGKDLEIKLSSTTQILMDVEKYSEEYQTKLVEYDKKMNELFKKREAGEIISDEEYESLRIPIPEYERIPADFENIRLLDLSNSRNALVSYTEDTSNEDKSLENKEVLFLLVFSLESNNSLFKRIDE